MELKIKISAATSMKKAHIAVLLAFWLVASAEALTDSQDVYALNTLYNSLSSPFLTGWKGSGGDPCAENWEGVACAGPNVTLLNLTGLSLTGVPGFALQNLTALIVLDLSNNLLSGGLPVQLPPHVQQLDLSVNQFTGNVPMIFSQLDNLNVLNISNNLLSGTLLDMFSTLEGLTTLDLSNNGFDGSLPPSFTDLTNLNALYLQNNSFIGTIDVLAQLPLKELDISNNNFTGWIPANLHNLSSSQFAGNSFNTSPAPPPPPLSVPQPSPAGSKSQTATEKAPPHKQTEGFGGYLTVGRLIGIVVAALLAVIVAILIIVFFVATRQNRGREAKYDAESSWQHRNLRKENSRREAKYISESPWWHVKGKPNMMLKVHGWKGDQKQSYVRAQDQKEELEPVVKAPSKTYKSIESMALKPPPVPLESLKPGKSKGSTPTVRPAATKISIAAHSYTIAELQLATQSFAEENFIGDGTLGKVYKAQMPNGQILAVKKLDYSISRVGQENFPEFLSKIAQLHHENIIQLVGYCVEHGEHLLVYDFVGNGTLQESLHSGMDNKIRLSWKARVRIALGVAKALEYLHEKCKPVIFHRNLTSANILLDDDLTPHLSDCGLANYFKHEQASAERLGYSAPEHTSSGIYTVESDTYSFGVVMLELLTGRKPLDSTRSRAEQSVMKWAVLQLYDIEAITKMLDPTIEQDYSKKSVSRFADVISQCVQEGPEFRPPMSEVVQSLEQLQNM